MFSFRWGRRGGPATRTAGETAPPGAAALPGRAVSAAGEPPAEAYLIPYAASSHERAITAHFAGDVAFESARHAATAPGAIFVCFSNRCGSNFLVSALASTGRVRPAGEAFNAPVVIERSKAAGHASFQAYVEQLAAAAAADGRTPCLKLGWMQLFFLDRWGYLDTVFPGARFVHIRREDLLGQAVSHAIAQATRAWTSRAEAGGEVVFDWEKIRRHVAEFADANACFDRFFALTGRPVARVVYEDLVADTAGWVQRFGAAIGEPLVYAPGRVRLERQDDPRKAAFRAEALALARRRAWEDAAPGKEPRRL